jgi:AraC-like DNA-binding protein
MQAFRLRGYQMLRPTPIRRYLSVMNAKGFAAEQVVKGADLDIDSLQTPRYLIDKSQYLRFVENMIALDGGEGLGLDIGLAFDIRNCGVLGHASLSCRSIRQSVEEFWGGYGQALGMMAHVAILRGDDAAVMVDISTQPMSGLAHRLFVEEALCMFLKGGSQVSGVEPRFMKLEFAYAAPRYAERYQDIFHCPVEFDAARTRATLSRTWFEMPLNNSDPELIELYREHLVQIQQQIETSVPLVAQLCNLFMRHDGEIPPLDAAAHELGFRPRTFRRQLHQQGHSYRKVVADFRTERALDCLRSGTEAVKQVSKRVGFDDVNAFRRAFKSWTGKTVHQYLAENTRLKPH